MVLIEYSLIPKTSKPARRQMGQLGHDITYKICVFPILVLIHKQLSSSKFEC